MPRAHCSCTCFVIFSIFWLFSLLFNAVSCYLTCYLTPLLTLQLLNLIRESTELLKKLNNFLFDFFDFLTYYRIINTFNCFLIASRSLNLITECTDLLRNLMIFFFLDLSTLLTPSICCYFSQVRNFDFFDLLTRY